MKKADIESKVEEMVMPIIDENGYSLWDVEYVKEGSDYYLSVYVDKEGGFTIEDCEKVSRSLDPLLDEADIIEDAYILEVSSPGLTRKLVKDKEFERSIGKYIKISLYKALDGEKNLLGYLKAFDADDLTVEITADNIVNIPRNNISMVRLEFEPE